MDNQAVVKALKSRNSKSVRSLRALPCRQLWAEVEYNLERWRGRGGEWESGWMRGHIERRCGDETKWNQKKWLNVQADAMATKARRTAQPVEYMLPVQARAWMSGGSWWVRGSGTGLTEWADSVAEVFSVAGCSREIQAYWSKRKEHEGRSGRQTPNWDTTLGRRAAGGKTARKGSDFFRTALWWDHLPSRQNRARFKGQVGETERTCNVCTRSELGSTWHVLAEGQYPGLVCRRKEVTETLLELLAEVEQEGTVPAA